MFLRTVKAPGRKGSHYEYLRLVENYRVIDKTKQRVIANLGRKDLLEAHLDSLIRILRGDAHEHEFIRAGNVEAAGAWDWGPVLVIRRLWRDVGLDEIIVQFGGRGQRDGERLAERAFVLTANRLCAPTSEHGLARWLETDFVCDSEGRRWTPQWREDEERLASRSPRVRVESAQLARWYRTLDQLHTCKDSIEKSLFLQLRKLFALQVDFALYDLTSTYFEGRGPEKAEHGYSRDGKPRNRQVLVGVVMIDGWLECPPSINARESSKQPRTFVQEVAGKEPGVRVFVAQSDERLDYERPQRTKSMERVRTELEALQKRVADGRLKSSEKIGEAAGRVLARNHGRRYFDWELKDGEFRYFEHPVNLPREQAFEGKYVIQTEEQNLNPVEAVALYKSLSEVERAFSNLKDVIDMRPIHHKTDARVEAHIQVAALAFLLHCALDKRLKAAGLDISATEALTVRLVEIDLGDGRVKRSVTRGSRRAATVLKALDITELDPPTPPGEGQTVV